MMGGHQDVVPHHVATFDDYFVVFRFGSGPTRAFEVVR